jgi:hypothetical protein
MQVIALVTGDEFLVPFNLTIDAEDMEDFLHDLTWIWFYYLPHNIGFDDLYGVSFYPNLGFSGMCYTFNVVEFEKIFYLERYKFEIVRPNID